MRFKLIFIYIYIYMVLTLYNTPITLKVSLKEYIYKKKLKRSDNANEQCNKVTGIGQFVPGKSVCYICGYTISGLSKLQGSVIEAMSNDDLGGAQCEHIIPFNDMKLLFGLSSGQQQLRKKFFKVNNKKFASQNPSINGVTEQQYLQWQTECWKLIYAWSHVECNQLKGAAVTFMDLKISMDDENNQLTLQLEKNSNNIIDFLKELRDGGKTTKGGEKQWPKKWNLSVRNGRIPQTIKETDLPETNENKVFFDKLPGKGLETGCKIYKREFQVPHNYAGYDPSEWPATMNPDYWNVNNSYLEQYISAIEKPLKEAIYSYPSYIGISGLIYNQGFLNFNYTLKTGSLMGKIVAYAKKIFPDSGLSGGGNGETNLPDEFLQSIQQIADYIINKEYLSSNFSDAVGGIYLINLKYYDMIKTFPKGEINTLIINSYLDIISELNSYDIDTLLLPQNTNNIPFDIVLELSTKLADEYDGTTPILLYGMYDIEFALSDVAGIKFIVHNNNLLKNTFEGFGIPLDFTPQKDILEPENPPYIKEINSFFLQNLEKENDKDDVLKFIYQLPEENDILNDIWWYSTFSTLPYIGGINYYIIACSIIDIFDSEISDEIIDNITYTLKIIKLIKKYTKSEDDVLKFIDQLTILVNNMHYPSYNQGIGLLLYILINICGIDPNMSPWSQIISAIIAGLNDISWEVINTSNFSPISPWSEDMIGGSLKCQPCSKNVVYKASKKKSRRISKKKSKKKYKRKSRRISKKKYRRDSKRKYKR